MICSFHSCQQLIPSQPSNSSDFMLTTLHLHSHRHANIHSQYRHQCPAGISDMTCSTPFPPSSWLLHNTPGH
ncbi:hypothetical protein BGZ63DRAFT_373493 [Mariannaea sp. PMI_226]|nr:hypothetical protein BGZ63DRAFT_373493 [Mariannaea sp. PMI_226]